MNLSARLKSMRTAKSSKRRLDIFKIKESPEIQKRPVVVSQILKKMTRIQQLLFTLNIKFKLILDIHLVYKLTKFHSPVLVRVVRDLHTLSLN